MWLPLWQYPILFSINGTIWYRIGFGAAACFFCCFYYFACLIFSISVFLVAIAFGYCCLNRGFDASSHGQNVMEPPPALSALYIPSRVHSLSLSLCSFFAWGLSGYDIHVESHLFDNWFEWLLSINNTLHANGGWHSHEFTWIHSHRKMHVLTQPALSLYLTRYVCATELYGGCTYTERT